MIVCSRPKKATRGAPSSLPTRIPSTKMLFFFSLPSLYRGIIDFCVDGIPAPSTDDAFDISSNLPPASTMLIFPNSIIFRRNSFAISYAIFRPGLLICFIASRDSSTFVRCVILWPMNMTKYTMFSGLVLGSLASDAQS